MAIGPSTTLQTSGLATTLNFAVKPGVQSGGNVTDLVSNTSKAVSMSAGCTVSSDVNGNYVDVTTGTDWCDIAYGLIADGNGFSCVLVYNLDVIPPADFATLMCVGVDSSHPAFLFCNFSESSSANSLEIDLNQFSAVQWFGFRDRLGAAGAFHTVVITWAGDGTPAKMFTAGNTFAPSFNDISGQNLGTAPTLTLSNDFAHSLGWPAKHYFFAMSNTTWTDTQAQSVADDVFGTLLTSGGSTVSASQAEAGTAAASSDATITLAGGGSVFSVAQSESGTALATSAAVRVAASPTVAFGSSTTLNTSVLATSLNRAYLCGVPGTGANTIKDIRQAADRAVLFHGAAALAGPDTDGNYMNIPNGATDWAEEAWDYDPAGGGYTVVMTVKLSDLNPLAWSDMFCLPTGTSGWHVFQFGRNNTTNDLWEGHNKFENSFFANGIDYLTANALVTLVVTWNGVDQPKLFATGKGVPKTLNVTLGAQDGGIPSQLRVAQTPTNDGGWSGKYYFFGWSDTTWADADAQAVADNIAGELFLVGGVGGGGPSEVIDTTLDRLSILPDTLSIETRQVTRTRVNGIETARRYSRITFPQNSNIIGQPALVQAAAQAAWGSPTSPPPPPPPGGGTGNGVVPTVTAVQNQGYQITADYTFGTVSGTIRDYTTLWQFFDPLQVDGKGLATVRALNDEWELYTDPKGDSPQYNGVTHILETDHLKLRTIKETPSLFDAAVNRALATSVPVTGSNPDGHYWGNWDGTQAFDTGVRSGNISTIRNQLGGYFEICCQLPDQNGSWPGFWIIARGGAWPPEIDIFEIPLNSYDLQLTHHGIAHLHTSKTVCGASPFDGSVPNRAVATISDAENGTGFFSNGTNWRLDYHVIGFEWLREGDTRGDHIRFWLDQILIYDGYFPWMDSCANISPAAVFQTQNAFGGDWPGRGGQIPFSTFPIDLKVKYIRMFAKAPV